MAPHVKELAQRTQSLLRQGEVGLELVQNARRPRSPPRSQLLRLAAPGHVTDKSILEASIETSAKVGGGEFAAHLLLKAGQYLRTLPIAGAS